MESDSLTVNKTVLCNARTAYLLFIEENKNNHFFFLFSTVAKLIIGHNSVEPDIPAALSSEDFMIFFNNKMTKKSGHIHVARRHAQL